MAAAVPTPTLDPSLGPQADFFANGPAHVDITAGNALSVLFFVIFAVWLIFSIIVLYHWMRYGRKSWYAVPLLVLYAFVSFGAITYMASALH